MNSSSAEIIDLATAHAKKKRAQSEQQQTPPPPTSAASRAYPVPFIPWPFMVYFVPVWIPLAPADSAVPGHA